MAKVKISNSSKAFVDLMLSYDDVVDVDALAKGVVDAVDNFQKGIFSKLQFFMFLDLVCNKLYEGLEVE